MIHTLALENFKAHRSTRLALGKMNLLVGRNAAGKSSVLQAVHAIGQFLHGRDGGFGLPEHATWPFKGGSTFNASASNGRETASLALEVISGGSKQEVRRGMSDSRTLWTHLFRLRSETLAAPAIATSVAVSLPEDGSGLAPFLRDLPDSSRETVTATLRSIVPEVEGVSTVRSPMPRAEAVGYQVRLRMRGSDVGPLDAGEGTLMLLGVLAGLAQDDACVFLFDDLEIGLHPAAQAQFCEHLRRFASGDPERQVIATSHSPFVANQFAVDEVQVVALDSEGVAHVKPLAAHPDAPRFRESLRAGEFWSAVGEQWVTAQ